MKTYNIDIVECNKRYYILDFTITRPIIANENSLDKALAFARGYKNGIMIDSNCKFSPKIQNPDHAEDIDKYVKQKKKYYADLWKKEV